MRMASSNVMGVCALVVLAHAAFASVAAAAEKGQDSEVLGTVGGREIQETDLDRSYESFGDALKEMPVLGDGDPRLERYINFRLISEAARDAGLAEDPEVRRTIEQMTDLILYRTFLLHFVNEVSGEAALRERYDLKYGNGEELRQAHVHHIRVEDEETARRVIEALEGGAAFDYLAGEHSVAPSAKDGGDLGFVGPGDLPAALLEAAFSLEPGEFTHEPVETPSGWEVIKVEARRLQKAPSFEDAKEKLAREAVEGSLAALLTKLREREGLGVSKQGAKE